MRLGVARLEHLIERLKRELDMADTKFTGLETSVVLLTDSSETLTKAAHAGRTMIVPNVSADRTWTLPTPEAGMHLHFVGFGALAADGHDVIFRSTDDTIFFHGALAHHDTNQTSQTTAVVWGDGSGDDQIKLDIPHAFDIHLVGKSSTVWYVYGWTASNTPVTISDA